jgi:hypothetical protein
MSSTSSKRRIGLIEQLTTEWKVTGRAGPAVRSLQRVARRDEGLARLVFGPDAPCSTPYDVVLHLRHASGRVEREEAAHLISVLLRESVNDPFLIRMLVQALVPGLISVAGKLQWGKGGEWRDAEDFFGELLGTAWLVLQEWAGQDRPYAVLDLLSAIRCRMRRQLFRNKERGGRAFALGAETEDRSCGRAETDLEELTRVLIDRHRGGMCSEEVQVLYANSVLGYSISELAAMTGRDRRALYAHRSRGRQNLCA